jgi:PPOX class probable F420-dependent enzyme
VTLAEVLDGLMATSWARAGEATRTSFPPERRIGGERLAAFLRDHHYAVLATTRADGRPHAAPVSYAVTDDATFWLPTATRAVRLRHVERTAWASLVVTEGEDDEHVVAIVEGPATVAPKPEGVEDREWAAAWLALRPERVLSYAAF